MPAAVDHVVLDVGAGIRVLVVSDVHLGVTPTETSNASAGTLIEILRDWEGPGTVVLAGDILELLGDDELAPSAIIAAYPGLGEAARSFAAGEERHLLYLVGNHDGRLAWDDGAAEEVASGLGTRLALAADLRIETARGRRNVRIEHGHRFDAANAFADPRDRRDTPIGQHVATEVLPAISSSSVGRLLGGVDHLNEPAALGRFFASRLLYRRLAPWLWVPLVPVLIAWALGTRWLDIADGVLLGELAVIITVAALFADRAWSAVARPLTERGQGQNNRARDAARHLAGTGYAGLVTGHTHHAEVTGLGGAFYANCGCCTEVIERRPTHWGFPPVWGTQRQLSWVELEGGADVSARLVYGRTDVAGSRLERLASRHPRTGPAAAGPPRVVASLADGAPWPAAPDPLRVDRRARRVGAAALGAAGLLGVVKALLPPLGNRLSLLREVLPLAVPQAAAALLALAGLALLLLARGVRHGQRPAWRLSIAILLLSAVLHLLKGFDYEESIISLSVVAYLLWHRSSFRARADHVSLRRGLVALSLGPILAIAIGTAVVELAPSQGPRLSATTAVSAVSERMVGDNDIAIRSEADDFLGPALLALGLGLAAFGLWLAFRPVISGRQPSRDPERARTIVRRHGRDTLAYFALRDDKEHFFHGESLVAYAIYTGICLVSPDPIGPVHERQAVWAAFRRFADSHGWTVAVLGATEEWLPIYRAGGMGSLYVGDEGIVDVRSFSLQGRAFKGLRQAVSRVANYGYRIEFHDSAHVDASMQDILREVMTHSRRGDVERGFSMTLGRLFDPDDRDMLLAVAFAPDGRPAAFAQFVPAPGIDGYSLDLMRRSDANHPNGVTDFVTVRTIEHLRERGFSGLGLNFATMRATLAGELGDGPTQRVQRWVLKKLSASMQIESLWKYNAKFAPTWQPRFAVWDAPENIVPAALAVAKAESFWELPVIGRFMVPKTDTDAPAPAAVGEASAAGSDAQSPPRNR